MTPLRQRMIEDMRIRNFSEHTIAAYVSAVYRLANHYHRSPDKLDREEIRAFLVDLVEQKQVSWPYYKQVLAGVAVFLSPRASPRRSGRGHPRSAAARSDCRSC